MDNFLQIAMYRNVLPRTIMKFMVRPYKADKKSYNIYHNNRLPYGVLMK